METSKVQKELSVREIGMFGVVLLAILWGALSINERAVFSSVEVDFIEESSKGLAIVPASCASSPGYFHADLVLTSDQKGYISYSGQSEYGRYTYRGEYICITNSTGYTYFVPSYTAAELTAFKNRAASIPGLSVWLSAGDGRNLGL